MIFMYQGHTIPTTYKNTDKEKTPSIIIVWRCDLVPCIILIYEPETDSLSLM